MLYQNRVLNITILVGAGQKLVIPVSCVEQGRWSWSSRDFESSKRAMYAYPATRQRSGYRLRLPPDPLSD